MFRNVMLTSQKNHVKVNLLVHADDEFHMTSYQLLVLEHLLLFLALDHDCLLHSEGFFLCIEQLLTVAVPGLFVLFLHLHHCSLLRTETNHVVHRQLKYSAFTCCAPVRGLSQNSFLSEVTVYVDS